MSEKEDKNVIQEATEAVKAKMREGKDVRPIQDKPEPSDDPKSTQ